MHTPRFRIITLTCLTGLLVHVAGASAQVPGQAESQWRQSTEPTDTRPTPKTLCALGRNGDHCASILLLELGARAGTAMVNTADVGLLINQGKQQAFGATIGFLDATFGRSFVTGPGVEQGWNLKLRYRRWLADYVGLDVGMGGGTFGSRHQWSAVGEVAIEFGDMIALTGGIDSIAMGDNSDRRLVATAGIRLGSYPVVALGELVADTFRSYVSPRH